LYFGAFRMIQTVLMGQYVLLHPKSNSQLQCRSTALLFGDYSIAPRGTTLRRPLVVSNI
jgi:hypothetical protein